jgi:hypothetical protein
MVFTMASATTTQAKTSKTRITAPFGPRSH